MTRVLITHVHKNVGLIKGGSLGQKIGVTTHCDMHEVPCEVLLVLDCGVVAVKMSELEAFFEHAEFTVTYVKHCYEKGLDEDIKADVLDLSSRCCSML